MSQRLDPQSLDATFRLAADWRRRSVVEYLRSDGKTEATLDELVEHLSTGSTTGMADKPEGPDALDLERNLLKLHNVHLPHLADEGIVEYDRERKVVHYDPRNEVGEALEHLLDELDGLSG